MHLLETKLCLRIETSDNEVRSDSENDYDPQAEMNINEDDHESEDDPHVRYEQIAKDAPPIDESGPPTFAPTAITLRTGSKKTKGQGPTKNLKVTEPMHLEYNALGQPCGKWRRQYGKQVGLSIRKISILHAWNEVSKGLKNSLWDDTMVSNFTIFIHLVSFYHRTGPKTYDEARKEWLDADIYPNLSLAPTSSMATSTSVNTPAGDRVLDLYCGIHSRDASGKLPFLIRERRRLLMLWK